MWSPLIPFSCGSPALALGCHCPSAFLGLCSVQSRLSPHVLPRPETMCVLTLTFDPWHGGLLRLWDRYTSPPLAPPTWGTVQCLCGSRAWCLKIWFELPLPSCTWREMGQDPQRLRACAPSPIKPVCSFSFVRAPHHTLGDLKQLPRTTSSLHGQGSGPGLAESSMRASPPYNQVPAGLPSPRSVGPGPTHSFPRTGPRDMQVSRGCVFTPL